jgi:beta-galactosidase
MARLDRGSEFRWGPCNIADVWKESAEWLPVELPHCFNAIDGCDPDRQYSRGQGWYRRHIAVRNPFAGGRTLLLFQGAGQTTTVWVGGTQMQTHTGGYDEFALDITDAAAEFASGGEAPVVVCCDNTPDRDRLPSDLSDFCLYGGLYRHVNLVYVPAVSLDAVHVLPVVGSNGAAHVRVRARLYNPCAKSSPCRLRIEIHDSSGRLVHQTSHTANPWRGFAPLDEFDIAQPERWSPESPAMYRCRVTLSTADGDITAEERFGIRHAEFVERGCFKLNGKRVLLQGTQRHADHAGVAAAMSDDQVREEMRMIREMGANFIRLAHYQQDRLVLELCDELGLMVWEELAWCRAGVGGDAFRNNARGMLTHMIEQHFNHPSVVFWGLGNEDDWPGEYPSMNKEEIRAFMTEMRDLAHELDGSRLTSFRRCDFARDIPDVYSPSIWAGWYRGTYQEYEASLLKERDRVKRFIHIEWGADSHTGRHSEDPYAAIGGVATGQGTDERGLAYLNTGGEARVSRDGDWSETYACDLFDWHLKTQEKLDWFSGSAQWIFKDFASPLRSENAIPRVNQKGVVERDLRPKESYYLFQSYWTKKPMVHIYGHSWPVRWGSPGQKRLVRVYSNCQQAELFLNGVSQGTKRRDSQDFPAAGLRWQVTFAAGTNHLRVVAHQGDITVTDEIGLEYQIQSWGKPAELRMRETGRCGGQVTVEVKAFDAHGVLCLDAQEFVRFSLAGHGRLIDNLGTTRASRKVQMANGRAEISLQPQGACQVNAAVAGLEPARLELSTG